MAAKTVVASGAGDSSMSEREVISLEAAKSRIYSDLLARFPSSTLLIGLTRQMVIPAKRTRPRYA